MLSIVRFFGTCAVVFGTWVSSAHAAIGDPCDAGVCPPGETCIPETDAPGFCTMRCNAEVDCGPELVCRVGGDLPYPMCLRPDDDVRVGIGGACDVQGDCEAGLLCFAENDARYCTRYCTVPGTCPEGFRCLGELRPACSQLRGLPGNQEPCAPDGRCADGFGCITHPSRGAPFCALPCTEGACAEGYACVTDHCVPNPIYQRPDFGEPCVADGADPMLVGCAGEGTCLVAESEAYCTRACGFSAPCPEGYGCIEPEEGRVECRRGAANDPRFTPPSGLDGGLLPPPSGEPPPPPPGAYTEPAKASNGGESGGCAARPGAAHGAWSAAAFGLVVLGVVVRRRPRPTRRP